MEFKSNDKEENESNEIVSKTKIAYELDNKNFFLQMLILQKIKKLKINLEVKDKNKSKSFYTNYFSLNDLISQNKFFNEFQDYSKAFNYLLNNFTKVEKTIFLPNNKDIKIILLFTINESSSNQNSIVQKNLEFILHNSNDLNKTKSNLLASTIDNLKLTLEKFNASINDLKLNIDNEKKEVNNLKNELQNMIDLKLRENIDDNTIIELKNKIKNIIEKKNEENKQKKLIRKSLDEIYSKLDNDEKQINELKIKIEENQKNNLKFIQNNNNIPKDNWNELSKTYNERFKDLLKKNNNLEENIKYNNERLQKFEESVNNKLSEFNNKINPNISKKNVGDHSSHINKQEISLRKEDDKLLEKIIQEKIEEQINNKVKIYEDKIQILNKKILDLEIKNQNKLVKDVIIKNEQSSFLNDNSYIDFKIHELEEKFNKNIGLKKEQNNNSKLNKETKDDFNNNKNKELNIGGKMKKNNFEKENKINQIIESKIEDLKEEIYSIINKINKEEKIDYKNKKSSDNNRSFDNINEKGNKPIKKKKNENEKEKKIKNINTNTSINMNNSYVINETPKMNSLNFYEDSESKSPKNVNISFNNYSSSNKSTKKKFDLNIDSKILKKEDISEDFFIFSKLKEIYQYNRFIRLILIYRGSRDGDTSKNFHLKCDSIGPNITLIKTKKGFIFGGFTIKSWKHLFKDIKNDNPEFGTEYKDKQSFGFSINLKKIYKNEKPNENVIFCNNNYGIVFNNFIKIFDEYYKNGGICGIKEESCFKGQEKEYEINGGEESFDIEEIEVFQIAFR